MKTQPRQHISNKYNTCTVVTSPVYIGSKFSITICTGTIFLWQRGSVFYVLHDFLKLIFKSVLSCSIVTELISYVHKFWTSFRLVHCFLPLSSPWLLGVNWLISLSLNGLFWNCLFLEALLLVRFWLVFMVLVACRNDCLWSTWRWVASPDDVTVRLCRLSQLFIYVRYCS